MCKFFKLQWVGLEVVFFGKCSMYLVFKTASFFLFGFGQYLYCCETFQVFFSDFKTYMFCRLMPLLDGIKHYPKEEVSVVIYLTSAHCVLVC